MKLERLSENQIRCTLNKADLADRELMLSELAYGTDKAKDLFRDMMEQANEELGFEVNDIPLMIEAIPVSPDCLILIITKVDNPDELENRFSKLTNITNVEIDVPDEEDSEEEDDGDILSLPDPSTLMESLSDIFGNIEKMSKKGKSKGKKKPPTISYRIFSFRNINEISKVAIIINPIYSDKNSLYKSPYDNLYYLIAHNGSDDTENFQRVCNLLSEYGTKVKVNYGTPYYFAEHFKIIIKDDAIQTLASIQKHKKLSLKSVDV